MGFLSDNKTKPKIKEKEVVEEKNRYVVVSKIPTQEIREHVSEDGTILHFITIEEALTEFVNENK